MYYRTAKKKWIESVLFKIEVHLREKTKPLLDSIRDNAPRFIETIPSSSSSTTIKNE